VGFCYGSPSRLLEVWGWNDLGTGMQQMKWWTRELGSQVEKSGDPGHLCQDEESGFNAKDDGCPWKMCFKKWNDVTCFQKINLAALWKIDSRVKMSQSREMVGSGWDQVWRWSWQNVVMDWMWSGKEQIRMTHRSWDWAVGEWWGFCGDCCSSHVTVLQTLAQLTLPACMSLLRCHLRIQAFLYQLKTTLPLHFLSRCTFLYRTYPHLA